MNRVDTALENLGYIGKASYRGHLFEGVVVSVLFTVDGLIEYLFRRIDEHGSFIVDGEGNYIDERIVESSVVISDTKRFSPISFSD